MGGERSERLRMESDVERHCAMGMRLPKHGRRPSNSRARAKAQGHCALNGERRTCESTLTMLCTQVEILGLIIWWAETA